MIRLSHTHQILLTPVVLIGLMAILLMLLIPQLIQISEQNETVRSWTYVIGHLQQAMVAGQELQNISRKYQNASSVAQDELHFNYLEQSKLFSDNVLEPELMEKMNPEISTLVLKNEKEIRYRENLDFENSIQALNTILPHLKKLKTILWVKKRVAYVQYYDNVKDITPQLIAMSLIFLTLCIIGGMLLAIGTIRHINKRLETLANDARQICAGHIVSLPAPTERKDKLDELAFSLSQMTQRLITIVSTEKILEGAEEERKRLSMDLHDQTLSELTGLSRALGALREHPPESEQAREKCLLKLDSTITETLDNVRKIMDDLHPQTLSILGLESTLRSHLENRLTEKGLPKYHLQIEQEVELVLNDFQKLMLYRITLEAINNVIRHARCERYEIGLRQFQNNIMLSIEDNGLGFDSTQTTKGNGIINIENRANAIGAIVSWSVSRFSSGTRLEIIFPTRNVKNVNTTK